MLFQTLLDSEFKVNQLMCNMEDKTVALAVPVVSEVFSLFHSCIRTNSVSSITEIPEWDKTDLLALKDGIYRSGNRLIKVTDAPPDIFKYLAFYAVGLLADSFVSQDLGGKYITTIHLGADGVHYEPESFSYLIKSDFFKSGNPRNIVPFLLLPSTIPEPLSYQWVYLAMRKFNKDLSPEIDYKYLAESEEELTLLRSWDLYD